MRLVDRSSPPTAADRRRAGTAGAATAAAPRPSCRRCSERPTAPIRTIAIDPGHGGDDEGAKGAGGAKEKDLTLAVARRLKSRRSKRGSACACC